MVRNLSLDKKIRIGLVTSLIFLLMISIISVGIMYNLNENAKMVEHSHEVILTIEEALSLIKDAETAMRGYIYTSNKAFLNHYYNCEKHLPAALSKLESLTNEDKEQIIRSLELRDLCWTKLVAIREIVKLQENNDFKGVAKFINEGTVRMLMDRIRYKTKELKTHEQYVLINRKRDTRISENLTYIIIGSGNFLAWIISFGALYYINKELQQRQLAEKTLQEKQTALESANTELEAFSYTISHDLRSPLRAIAGFSQILEDDYKSLLDNEGVRILKIITDNTNKMGRLIDDMLDFSRLNRQEVAYHTVNMNELVAEVINELQMSGWKKMPTLEIQNLPSALGDRALLHQVWINLISNAFKYSSKKSDPKVEIGFMKSPDNQYFYVRDNGAGFDEKYKDKLFGLFQRLHSMKEFEGNGVGLAIVQRIIFRHGGYIKAEGKLKEGATFKFYIPIADERRSIN